MTMEGCRRRILKHAERRSRSKEDRVERDVEVEEKLKGTINDCLLNFRL